MAIFIAIVVIIILPYLIAACTGTFLYWYEAANNPCEKIGNPKPGFLLCASMLIGTLAGYMMAIASHPLGWLPRKKINPWHPDGSLSHHPVVLLHGIYHNPSAWLLVERRLEKAGYVVSNFAYHSFFVPLDNIMKKLDDQLHLLEATYPGKKPILVGHSMGGIVIRKWLATDSKNAKRIGGVITLATPHGGSKLAALAPGELVKKITPFGSLIKELEETPTPKNLPCVSLVSPTDEIVLPSQCLLPPEGWKMRTTEYTSHFGILLRKGAANMLLEELAVMEKAMAQDTASAAPKEKAAKPKSTDKTGPQAVKPAIEKKAGMAKKSPEKKKDSSAKE